MILSHIPKYFIYFSSNNYLFVAHQVSCVASHRISDYFSQPLINAGAANGRFRHVMLLHMTHNNRMFSTMIKMLHHLRKGEMCVHNGVYTQCNIEMSVHFAC